MPDSISIHWFRQDLRLEDNPALLAAVERGQVLPIYILDDENAKEHTMGGASRWWLHHSLCALNTSLGGKLCVYSGDAQTVLADLCARHNVHAVHWNRCYEPWRTKRDAHIKAQLTQQGVAVHSHNGSLLWEPWQVKKGDGTPYKVFTPFYRRGCMAAPAPRAPLPAPRQAAWVEDDAALPIAQLGLLPTQGWDAQLAPHWHVGEAGAKERFCTFAEHGLHHYKEGRDFPAKAYVSRLSPHLHFGEVSPNQLWNAVQMMEETPQTQHFCSELAWREFSYSQLYYNPDLPQKNLNRTFDAFAWQDDERLLQAWRHGQTGVPIVDAGMRELWQTGYMHNRVRMVVGSFLVKNLLQHWRHGERWFWDTLVDADLASNSASWQWVAGCGADAAPYFRIFNPVMQGQRFDAQGEYTRQFVPELADMPAKYLFNPWEAPEAVLAGAGVRLGENYPQPIVELKASRTRALAALQAMKQAQ